MNTIIEFANLFKDMQSKITELEEEVKKLKTQRKIYKQNEIMKMYHISHQTITKWENEGLPVIFDGKSKYYNLNRLEEFLDRKAV